MVVAGEKLSGPAARIAADASEESSPADVWVDTVGGAFCSSPQAMSPGRRSYPVSSPKNMLIETM